MQAPAPIRPHLPTALNYPQARPHGRYRTANSQVWRGYQPTYTRTMPHQSAAAPARVRGPQGPNPTDWMAEQQRRIQQNNARLMQAARPPLQPLPPMQGVSPQRQAMPSQAWRPNPGASGPSGRQALERQYLEARADFLNTKYVPNGYPPRWTADSVRGGIGTGMPLPPTMMGRDSTFNPVLQKAQHAEMLRRQLQNYPTTPGLP